MFTDIMRQFIGEVINNKDPKEMGRVQVRIKSLHDQVGDEDLPWAIPLINSEGHGIIDVPTNGHRIYVTFQDEDRLEPMYGGLVTSPGEIHDEFSGDDYPYRHGFWDKYGNYCYRDIRNGRIYLNARNRVTFEIDAQGNIVIIGGANFDMRISGNINITAGGNVQITGARIDLN